MNPKDLKGLWSPINGDAEIEFYIKGDHLLGRIVSGTEEGEKDSLNPDSAKRDRALRGLEIFIGFKITGKPYLKGEIYDPQNGNTYRSRMSLNKKGLLKVRGYVGIPLLGRTEYFVKIKTEKSIYHLQQSHYRNPLYQIQYFLYLYLTDI